MCGICGELNLAGDTVNLQAVDRMLPTLAQRGPDRQGAYQDGPVALGHRRLSIIDLSHHADQPMLDAALGLALVFNGTIYNYKDLRRQLCEQGYRFFSQGDTEVILKAYHFWGQDCVQQFDGMFAFALWDKRDQSLFLARDRLGIKPLYYSVEKRIFRFASRPHSLLAAGGVNTQIDPVSLHHLFSLHAVVPAPRTILQGIRKCPPAHSMRIVNQMTAPRCYWSLDNVAIQSHVSELDWCERIKTALQAAVAKRLHAADVPVGVLLSGGLDSSLLVALLAKLNVADLRTFSIGFEDHAHEKGSEFEYSDQVVQRYGTAHCKLTMANSTVLDVLPACVESMSEPMFAQDAVAFYLLSKQVAQEIKVVLSGQGADEVFAGYFWYALIDQAASAELDGFGRYYFDRDHAEMAQLLTQSWISEDYTEQWVGNRLTQMREGTLLDKVLRLDVQTLVVDDPVKRVDNMTMAWGLEARVPFLDQHLVELAATIPAKLKLKLGGKNFLKQIARDLLPSAVIDRPKGYFPLPALKYIKGPFFEFVQEILMSRSCKERGLYRADYVAKLLKQPEQHLTRIKGNKLWHLAVLEYWLQCHVDGARP